MPDETGRYSAHTELPMATLETTLEQLRVHLKRSPSGFEIRVAGLTGDEDFDPTSNCYFRTAGSLRWEVNRVLKEEAQNQGLGHRFHNHEKWPGTTGWVIYGDGVEGSAAAIARKVAHTFGATLIDHQ